jgi:anti-sigma factor RsiW
MSHAREQCLQLADRLSEYLDGELPDALRDAVVDHFRDCANCVTFIESLRRTRNLGQFLPEVALSEAVLKRLSQIASRRLGL